MIRYIKLLIKKIIPDWALSLYHLSLARLAALWYRHPSQKLIVIGVTGTKGKSTTAELINSILEANGHTTAVSGTIRFKIGDKSRPNTFKMSMPGRGFMQHFLRQAVDTGCTHAVIEMTSEGARQNRHRFIDLDALIFTNLSLEHIESHGSYENYVAAKLSLAHALEKSSKKEKWIVANADDEKGADFLATDVEHRAPYSLKDLESYDISDTRISFRLDGHDFISPLRGLFNLYNIIAAVTLAKHFNISNDVIQKGLSATTSVRGRVEYIDEGQNFDCIVDYAHTPDSLEKLYQTFENKRKICVLGNTGGGRDTWKRPEMGRIADQYCDEIILTNEDPYDEDPQNILSDMKKGFSKHTPEIILDRREAIHKALEIAQAGTLRQVQGSRNQNGYVVLITGKGTDPYIMGPEGTKQKWDDATVVCEELKKI